MSDSGEVTILLDRWNEGETGVLNTLLPLVYADLRRMADRSLRKERNDHTLQPTALVHEAYMRLAGSHPPNIENRSHFLYLAARVMRQILVDHARRVRAARRLGQASQVPLTEAEQIGTAPSVDLLELDDALQALAKFDLRKSKVIELRFFGGFQVTEVAKLLNISVPTVVTDTKVALAWLFAQVDEGLAEMDEGLEVDKGLSPCE